MDERVDPAVSIHLVGNSMIDRLIRIRPHAEKVHACGGFSLDTFSYTFVMLHSGANVDGDEALAEVCAQLAWLGAHARRVPRPPSDKETPGGDGMGRAPPAALARSA